MLGDFQRKDDFRPQLPYKPYCTNELSAGLHICPREAALRYNYIQLNSPCLNWALVFDIDYPAGPWLADDVNLPRPTFCIQSKQSGYAHFIYALLSPVCTSNIAHSKPLYYAEAIERAFRERFNADHHYTGLIAKNPWKTDTWRVYMSNLAYDLTFLGDSLGETLNWKPIKQSVTTISGLGRNCYLFEVIRHWSYSAIRSYWNLGTPDWEEAVYKRTYAENLQFSTPLPEQEVRCLARSIAKWVWKRFRPESFTLWQKRHIEKRWGVSKCAKGIQMLLEGFSIKEIATTLNISPQTVRIWRKSMLTDKQTNSELKP